MAIKKFNGNNIGGVKPVVGNNTTGTATVTPKIPVVKEQPVVEESTITVDEDVEDLVEVEEPTEVVVEEKPVIKTVSGKKSLKKNKKPVASKPKTDKIGNIYPKEKIYKELQAALDDEYELSLKDAETIFNTLESILENAASKASVRFMGGILKTLNREQQIRKAPTVDYYTLTQPTKVYTLVGTEISPEKYRGYPSEDGTTFNVISVYDAETKKWVDAEGTINIG